MLVSLYVKDFAIVREVEIAPAAGLTVVSGETGAGKSLLVDALMLLTGARADAGVVRHGAERAELIARFSPPRIAAEWLREAALDEDGECQLRRVIRADGGSRAWINGRPATLAQLTELGALLVEIHGQHEHQALLDRRHQLALLDAFAQHTDELAQLRDSARDWQRASQTIATIEQRGDSHERRQFLSHQIDELTAENLAPEAIEALIAEHRRQSHATALIEGCARVASSLETDLPGLVRRLRHELARLAAQQSSDNRPSERAPDEGVANGLMLESVALQIPRPAESGRAIVQDGHPAPGGEEIRIGAEGFFSGRRRGVR